MSNKFLVNPTGRVVDVSSPEVAGLLRTGFRYATEGEIRAAYPAYGGGGPRDGALGYDDLSNIKGPAIGNVIGAGPSIGNGDDALAKAGEAKRAEIMGTLLPGGTVVTNTPAALAALAENKRHTQAEDTLNAAIESAPSSITDSRVSEAQDALDHAKAQAEAEESARMNREIEQAALRAQGNDAANAAAKAAEAEKGKLTGNSELPEDFPGKAALTEAGLKTLGDVADHDFDKTPVPQVGTATRKNITEYLARPNVELND